MNGQIEIHILSACKQTSVSFRFIRCQVLCPTSDQKVGHWGGPQWLQRPRCGQVSLALENISAQYAGFEGRSEMQGKVQMSSNGQSTVAAITWGTKDQKKQRNHVGQEKSRSIGRPTLVSVGLGQYFDFQILSIATSQSLSRGRSPF